MNLNSKQRAMLANAKSYVATVSRQAELAKDLPLAHQLADIVADLMRVMSGVRTPFGPRVLPFTRKES